MFSLPPPRSPLTPEYLESLAVRLSEQANIPIETARLSVKAVAVLPLSQLAKTDENGRIPEVERADHGIRSCRIDRPLRQAGGCPRAQGNRHRQQAALVNFSNSSMSSSRPWSTVLPRTGPRRSGEPSWSAIRPLHCEGGSQRTRQSQGGGAADRQPRPGAGRQDSHAVMNAVQQYMQ
jgi:hypothetical protein